MMGLNSYRNMLRMKKDPFGDYNLKDTDEDKQKLIELSNTICDISKVCFRTCANVSKPSFSRKEEKCIKKCVNFHYNSMLTLIKYHNNKK